MRVPADFGNAYIEAISAIVAQVASAPIQASRKPYTMLTPLPFMKAVVKNLDSLRQHDFQSKRLGATYGMADSQVHIYRLEKSVRVV